jgi:hypothetical protein
MLFISIAANAAVRERPRIHSFIGHRMILLKPGRPYHAFSTPTSVLKETMADNT